MGCRQTYILTPISDDDGICASQSPLSAGNLSIDGVLAANDKVILGTAHLPTLTSDADDSLTTFVFYGKDNRGVLITETILGPNATTKQLTKYFSEIDLITIDGPSVGNITVGINGLCISPWVYFPREYEINIGLDISLSAVANLTYSVIHTFDDIEQNVDFDISYSEHAEIFDETANDVGNYAFPAVGYAVIVKAFTNGTLTFNTVQSF